MKICLVDRTRFEDQVKLFDLPISWYLTQLSLLSKERKNVKLFNFSGVEMVTC